VPRSVWPVNGERAVSRIFSSASSRNSCGFSCVRAAGRKGSLVALFFMHLNHERKMIYWVLMLTAVFFVVLMLVPIATNLNKIVQKY